MIRRVFYAGATLLLVVVITFAIFRPAALWALVVIGPLLMLGLYDILQREHTILRNFPIIGHGRYLFEAVRPEIQQYFIESNTDAFPIEREYRDIVYKRAKGTLETQPFGTQHDVYRVGYEWAAHSLAPVEPWHEPLRVQVGGPDCRQPYSSSLLNISAMSFGALSGRAVLALNGGAKAGGFAHNTGEGGISPYHLEPGGDLIWQIGTGYFGCRTSDGRFDAVRFKDQAAHDSVRMIEVKLSQGAKPGHGGVLPGAKVSEEIAAIRGVPPWETVFSLPRHSSFSTLPGLLEFVAPAPRSGRWQTDRLQTVRRATVRSLLELLGAMGLSHPRELGPHHIFHRVTDSHVRTLAQLHHFLSTGDLLTDGHCSGTWRDDWRLACASGTPV